MTSRVRRQRDRGAAAVEFALVSPLLFMLLFGVIDYGLYMADVLSVQQGVSDAAREATLSVSSVAASWPGSTTCGALAVTPSLAPAATNDLTRVACRVGETVQPLGGGVVVAKAEVVDADGHPTATWAVGNRLRVCAVTRHDAVLPFVPLPDGGIVTTRADMPIQPGGVPMLLNPVAQDVRALGTDWSWC
jgi:Flp pilus assembly protein TadG